MSVPGYSTAQRISLDLAGYHQDTVEVGYEVSSSGRTLIKRKDYHISVLSFFEVFNDSVEVYHNNNKIVSWYIHKDNNPYTSTGYSGKEIAIYRTAGVNEIVIKLIHQKKYIKFNLKKEYPLYSIQRYQEIWHVNARKYVMVLM